MEILGLRRQKEIFLAYHAEAEKNVTQMQFVHMAKSLTNVEELSA